MGDWIEGIDTSGVVVIDRTTAETVASLGPRLTPTVITRARLLAAAPDLYEALKAYQDANPIHNDHEDALHTKAAAALARVTGREPTP